MPRTRPIAKFDEYQFFDRVRFLKDSGLAYGDLQSMRVKRLGAPARRRLPTPVWALRDDLLREVLVAYIERRNHVLPPQGTLHERLERCRAAAKKYVPGLSTTRNRLIEEYRRCASENPEAKNRLRTLEMQIQNKDSEAWIAERGQAEVISSIVYLYYRLGWNSCSVGEELEMSPCAVRQILHRLGKVGRAICEEAASQKAA